LWRRASRPGPWWRGPWWRRGLSGTGLLWLLRLNESFDRMAARLGRTGQWLRSRPGRRTLGAAGLALIALALVWCLHDWLGWTWFNLSVE